MTTAVLPPTIPEMSPRAKARVTGALYLLTIITGIIAEGFISGRLVVSGNAAATAANILAHEPLYRLGFTTYLVEMACQIATTVLFYELLKPVSKSAALLAMVFGLVGCTIKTLSRLFYFAPLLVLGGAHYLSAFNADQLPALALLFLRVNDQGAAIALAFFGFETVLEGYLIMRSTFLPRALGVVAVVAGLGWLTFLWLPLGYRAFPYVAAIGILGSLATITWLLTVGVNEQRWKEQAAASATSIWR
jgi:hypothetical protein